MPFSQHVNQIAARLSRKRRQASLCIHRACFEALEGRTLCSVSFQAAVPAASNISPSVGADLNGDGRTELVAIDAALPQINVWLGSGNDTFQASTPLSTPAMPTSVQVADFNGDGHADILVTYLGATGTTTVASIFMGNGDGTFQSPVNQDLGSGVTAVTTADFNGDGKLDLFAVTSNAGPFQNTTLDGTYLGNGDGTFGSPVSTIVNGNGMNVTVGDFNGDGHADIAIGDAPTISSTDLLSYTVSTLMGKGDGSFQFPVDQTVDTVNFGTLAGTRAPFVKAADLNGDGKSDLIATINLDKLSQIGGIPPVTIHSRGIGIDTIAPQPGLVKVMMGSSTGLQSPVTYNPGVAPGLTQAADVNHDGQPDLIIQSNGVLPSDKASVLANGDIFVPQTSGAVTVLLNKGGGTFGAPLSYITTASGPVVTADFNGDGNLDLYLPNNTILHGNGDGSFQGTSSSYVGPGASTMAGNGTDAQATGDFNGDGKLDVAVTDFGAGTVSVFLGKGNGTFADPTVYAVGTDGLSGDGPRGITTGDFNGDGRIDLAMAVEGAPGQVSILYGNGDGTFQNPIFKGVSGQFPFSISAADFNGDGISDILLTDPVAKTVEVMESGPAGRTLVFPAGVEPSAVVGDFNGDGKPDFASNTQVFLNDGTGNFTTVNGLSLGFGLQEAMAVGDFNGDGKLDLAVHVQSDDILNANLSPLTAGSVSVMLGNGDGTFSNPVVVTPAQQIPQVEGGAYVTSAGSSIAVADVNGDGIPDLLVNGVNSVEVSLGRGDGGFYGQTTYTSTAGVGGALAVGDFNGDGKPDVAEVDAAANHQQFVEPGYENVLLNSGIADSNFGAVGFKMSAPPIVTENDPFAVTVSAVDANGNVVPGFLGTVSLFSDKGIATPYTFTAADGGTHTFSNAFNFIGGTHTLSAGAPFLAAANVSVTALPGSFSATYPSTTVAGAPVPLTINALDAFGNPLTTFNAALNITSSDPKARSLTLNLGTVDGGTLVVPGVPGFLSLLTAGNQTVSVTSPYMLPFTSAPILVTPGVATTAQFGLPAAVTAGVPFTFSVSAVDNFGNVSPIATPTINFSATEPGLTLPASYMFTPADAGVHSFTATATLALSTFLLSSGGVVGSGALQVNPAAVTHLGLSSAVPQPTAGAGFTLLVSGYDAFGNPSPGSIFHLTSSDARATLPADSTGIAATFDTVSFKTAGTQTITVVDPTNPSIIGATETFNVTPAAATTLLVSTAKSAVAGAPQAVTVTAQDAFGNLATGYVGTVHFLSSDARASLPANYAFTAADVGVHTFSTAFGIAGSQSITAQDTGNATVAGSEAGIAVVPGAAASFAVSGFPATVAGVAHTFTVTPKDAFGNVITGYTGTVNFSSSDVQAGLPANYTFTAADAGSHTFTATLKTAGTQSLTVTDAANGAAGTQGGIVVTAGAATHFVVSGPSTVTSGKATPITVTALDAYGNLATSYRGKVHFTDTVSAGLPSDYTFNATDNGSHTFNVTFNTVGLQTLKVTDTVTSTITGNLSVTDSSSTGGGGGGGGKA